MHTPKMDTGWLGRDLGRSRPCLARDSFQLPPYEERGRGVGS